MRFVMFYHSLVSDWNHGNAHFLRGIVAELLARGHDVQVYEPSGNWSLTNLLENHGSGAVESFQRAFPHLRSRAYDPSTFDLASSVSDADVVLVHEWNDPVLIAALGELRANAAFRLFFHDTHHRALTAPAEMRRFELQNYDGVLAFGRVIRAIHLDRGWARAAWVWHEAADARVFRPQPNVAPEVDVVWVGNWGDDERAVEIFEFLIEPVRRLRLSARVYGVRYPAHARAALRAAGIEYGGWLPNYQAPSAYARARVTLHIPRRPYARALPGVPTIRMFEALACGIPLISAPWDDMERLFEPGQDYLVARSGDAMCAHLETLIAKPRFAQQIAEHGRRRVLNRHTCTHRVNELLGICAALEHAPPAVMSV